MANAKVLAPPGFVTAADFARKFGAPANHVHAMAMRGDLEYTRVGRWVYIAVNQTLTLNPDYKHINGRKLGERKWVAGKR